MSYVCSTKPWASETNFGLFHGFYWDLQRKQSVIKLEISMLFHANVIIYDSYVSSFWDKTPL
jgi:hypothetical protein